MPDSILSEAGRPGKSLSADLLPLVACLSFVLCGTGGCRPHSPAPKVLSSHPTNEIGVISHWDSPLHFTYPPTTPAAEEHFQELQKQARCRLNSQRPFHEVDVPLFFVEGRPCVDVLWAGRKVVCDVDTGSALVSWPQWLHLDTQQLNISRTMVWLGGARTREEWMLSPRIEIGDAVLTGIPTLADGFSKPGPGAPWPTSRNRPILGMEAFNAFVMTLDFRAHRLVLRDPSYDVTRLPRTVRSKLIPYRVDKWGMGTLPGMLEGHKATFILDTGTEHALVSAEFARKHGLPVSRPVRAGNAAAMSLPFLRGVACSMGGIRFKNGSAAVIENRSGGDVLMGASFCRWYRVTIDRFRGYVLAERFPDRGAER